MSPRSTALAALAVPATVLAGPALAHPGDHHGLALGELLNHYATGWHILPVLIGVAGVVGALLLRPTREVRAKSPAKQRTRGDA